MLFFFCFVTHLNNSQIYNLKGTVPRDFRPLVFFIKQSSLGPNSWAKALSNMV
jgi:hypothetical protein